MTRLLSLVLVVMFLCVGCGSGGSSGSGGGGGNIQPAEISGKWQMIGTSSQNLSSSFPFAGIEATLSQTGSAVSSGRQATLVIPFYVQGTNYSIAGGDACGDYAATMSGAITGRNISFTLTEGSGVNTYVVTGTATISSDGRTMSGTYTSTGGCGTSGDSGTFAGSSISSLSGTYNTYFDNGVTLTFALTEDSSHNISATGNYQATNFTLTGETVGGAVAVSGDVPTIGNTTYVGFYMNSSLVSLVPTVNGHGTSVGDLLIFGSDDSIGLAQKQ